MTEAELEAFLRVNYPKEDEVCEWKEFKNLRNAWNSHKSDDVESYISAIANMSGGYLIIGVEDKTLRIVGIQDFGDYTCDNARARLAGRCAHLNAEKLKIVPYETSDCRKTVWVICVPKHEPRLPVYAHGKPWQRIGDSLLPMTPERLDAILREPIEHVDWSAQIVEGATVGDLDPAAIAKAREKFSTRNAASRWAAEIPSWDTPTFLDKAKITAGGKVTRRSRAARYAQCGASVIAAPCSTYLELGR